MLTREELEEGGGGSNLRGMAKFLKKRSGQIDRMEKEQDGLVEGGGRCHRTLCDWAISKKKKRKIWFARWQEKAIIVLRSRKNRRESGRQTQAPVIGKLGDISSGISPSKAGGYQSR